ncbi:MAG TPA: imidazole glycerol phosphate synthase subunit HisH [Verrucomicrobiota bacterium]|nr:imidazole glycerol phosphate synthase subunit HisH [Verrucomicrobiota bacterium]
MIALIDYGAGNLRSVEKALAKVGADVRIFKNSEGFENAQGIVLPGVGAFDDCVNALRHQDLFNPLIKLLKDGKPFLGICIGYQVLFERSEEFNSTAPGLSIFKGNVVRFTQKDAYKIPQIGWNQLEFTKPDCPIFAGIPNKSYFYFVHSYYPKPDDESIVASWTDYADRFASSIWKDNIFAVQFHPEKSQNVGLKMLKNFIELCEKQKS